MVYTDWHEKQAKRSEAMALRSIHCPRRSHPVPMQHALDRTSHGRDPQPSHSLLAGLAGLLLFCSLGSAQPSITPNPVTVVTPGGTLQFSASGGTGPYTWTLESGSVGGISAGGLYTGPASILVKQHAGGCQIQPAGSIFNTRVDALPVHADSATWITLLSSSERVSFSISFGTNIATNATPLVNLVTFYTPANDGNYPQIPWPLGKRESGWFSAPLAEVDRHELTVNRSTCELSELYNEYPAGTQDGREVCMNGSCTAQSAVKITNGYTFPTLAGTDAAGLPILPFLVRAHEIRSGEIKHMMRMALNNNKLHPSHVWPATANAVIPTGLIPYGAIMRLKSSYNISGFSAVAQVILTALKRYGQMAVDGGLGGVMDSQFDTDTSLDPTIVAAVAEILTANITPTNFEFVDQASLMVSSTNWAVKYDNAYQVPAEFAVVKVTDAMAAVARAYIPLQGVVVGVPETSMWVQSGGPARQLESWVTPSSTSQTVTFAKDGTSTTGTITSGGVYTPPATMASPTTTTVTLTSSADATATQVIKLTVMPVGTIRIDSGNLTDFVGAATWWKDQAGETAIPRRGDGSSGWPVQTDIDVFFTRRYGSGDTTYRFYMAAAGNYKASVSLGVEGSGAMPVMNPATYLPQPVFVSHLESGSISAGVASSQLVARNFDLGAAAVNYATPIVKELPCQILVAGDPCIVSIRNLSYNLIAPNPHNAQINALMIAADGTAPHLTIDGLTTDITFQQTRQFYAIGWYMSASATWSVVSGVGSVDSSGLYTAPSLPPASTTSVTVRATSTVDGSKTADITFSFVFGTMAVSPATATVSRGQTSTFTVSIGGVSYTNVAWTRSGSQGSIGVATGIYQAPASITDGDITITATSLDDGSKTGTATLTLQQIIDVIYIDTGNNSSPITDGSAHVWAIDGGVCTAPSLQGVGAGQAVTGATSDMWEIYNSARYNSAADSSFTCTHTVPNGLYSVRLLFNNYGDMSNVYTGITITGNGVVFISNWNFNVQCGIRVACDLTQTVKVTDGSLVLTFSNTGSPGGVFVNGIQITDLGPAPPAGIVGRTVVTGAVVVK